MKFTLVAAALSLASVTAGQSISDLPPCALSCFIAPLRSDGCKSLTDYKCHCEQSGLVSKVEPCVQSKCSAADQQKVLTGVEKLCANYGISLTITTSAVSTSSVPSSYSKSAVTTTSSVVSTSPITTSKIYTYPTGNGTSPTSPISTPTAAAGKASFGGAVALVAAGAAMAGL